MWYKKVLAGFLILGSQRWSLTLLNNL
ncbi:hypothetical protein FHY13_001959 [Xanthomonas arboricola]|nr:hypothetical protein [Xanthomonas euroxanthea]